MKRDQWDKLDLSANVFLTPNFGSGLGSFLLPLSEKKIYQDDVRREWKEMARNLFIYSGIVGIEFNFAGRKMWPVDILLIVWLFRSMEMLVWIYAAWILLCLLDSSFFSVAIIHSCTTFSFFFLLYVFLFSVLLSAILKLK